MKRRALLSAACLILISALAAPAAAEFGEIGPNDFRVIDGFSNLDDQFSAVAYSPLHDLYLVVWQKTAFVLPNGAIQIEARLVSGASGLPVSDVISPLDVQVCPGGLCASDPAVAYSATADRFVVVASVEGVFPSQEDREFEIAAFDVDPATGASSWSSLMSAVGPDDDEDYGAFSPDVACSSATDHCLVVWSGDDNVGGLVDNEFEIFGHRFVAGNGAGVGTDVRLSDAGGTGSTVHGASSPAVAYSSGDDEYLVVWGGNDDVGGLSAGEFEVFGQRLVATTGAETGTNDFRISDMGGTGTPTHNASLPAVAYAASLGQYLVVWHGDDNVGGLVDNEFEIFGQRLIASTGAETGTNDFRISDLGGTGNAAYDASAPAVTFGAALDEYLVTWRGDDDLGGLLDNEVEVFGQRLAASTGAEVGANDFRVSDLGGTGENLFDAQNPKLAYNSERAEYLVVWYGDDDDELGDEVTQVFAQRLGEQEVFADGFESGNTSAWSLTFP